MVYIIVNNFYEYLLKFYIVLRLNYENVIIWFND